MRHDFYFGIASYNRVDRQPMLTKLHEMGFPATQILLATQTPEDYEKYSERYGKWATVLFRSASNCPQNKNTILEHLRDNCGNTRVLMFGSMVFQTWLVASGGGTLKEVIKLFWTTRIPWGWTYSAGMVPDWIAQFCFGFYSLMLTSTLIGLIVMVLYKPRTWCSFCPMGTMTQGICKLKSKDEEEM